MKCLKVIQINKTTELEAVSKLLTGLVYNIINIMIYNRKFALVNIL